ncbi:MAG: phosphatase PAP2 family protein [Thermomicrobiales bacterium]
MAKNRFGGSLSRGPRTFRDRHSGQFNSQRLAFARGRQGFLIVTILLGIFAVLFSLVWANKTAATDAAVTLRLQKRDHPHFDRLMRIVSWPGFPPQSRIIPPSIAGVLWMLGFRLEAVFQLMAWGTGFISFTVKRIMRRSRPTSENGIKVAVANIGGSSFPSGHVINYVGVYGFLAYLAFTWIRPSVIRRTVVGLLTGLLALVGPSRIYLGHHWLTDTMASYLLGSSYLIVLTGVYRRVRMWVNGQ